MVSLSSFTVAIPRPSSGIPSGRSAARCARLPPRPRLCRRSVGEAGRRRSWIGSIRPLWLCAEPLSADRAAAAACAEHRRLAGGHRVPRARLAREAHDRKVVRDAVALQHVVPRCNMLCSACNMLCSACDMLCRAATRWCSACNTLCSACNMLCRAATRCAPHATCCAALRHRALRTPRVTQRCTTAWHRHHAATVQCTAALVSAAACGS